MSTKLLEVGARSQKVLICLQEDMQRWMLPRWLRGKESACHARDMSLIPGSGRSPGIGNANPLQYSCLQNPMDRGA